MPFVKIAINYLQATAAAAATGARARATSGAQPPPLLPPSPRLRPLAPQLTAYAVTFPLQWPAQLVDIFEAMRRISYPPVQLNAIDCQFSDSEGSFVFERFVLCAARPAASAPSPRDTRPPLPCPHRRARLPRAPPGREAGPAHLERDAPALRGVRGRGRRGPARSFHRPSSPTTRPTARSARAGRSARRRACLNCPVTASGAPAWCPTSFPRSANRSALPRSSSSGPTM